MTRLARFALIIGLALASIPAAAQERPVRRAGVASIEVLDVGQGDAILIRSPEGKTALVDAGPSHHVVELLRQRNVKAIDLVVVSHHHQDHYGGMSEVIKTYRPKVFLATDSSHTTPHYLRLLQLVRDSGMQAIFPTDAPRKLQLGSVLLTVLPQPPEDPNDENNNSIGIGVQYGSFTMLLTGDSQAHERAFWEMNSPDLIRNSTVLKLAHHGSKDGTDARWLDLVRPRLAVASMGRGNEFGHPHPQTLALLERRDIPVLRTDLDGTIEIASDGERWQVVSPRQAPRGPPVAGREAHAPSRESRAKPARESPGRVVNVNTATQEELEALPGIGPVIARRIIEGRPYRSVDELDRVKGIGKKRLDEIRSLVTVK